MRHHAIKEQTIAISSNWIYNWIYRLSYNVHKIANILYI